MMGEWSTYSLDDFLMFSARAWYRMLELHNRAWWPLQIVAAALGLCLTWALHRRLRPALRLGLVLAGAGLLFVAWSFHWGPHAGINLAAPYFALAFGAQGVWMIGLALLRPGLVLERGSDATTRLALALLVGALLLFPVLAVVWMRPMAQAQWFALAPDPTMLAALAVVLLLPRSQGLRRPALTSALLMVVPLSWSAATGLTLWTLDAADWWLMPAAGLLACGVAGWQAAHPSAL